MMISQSVTKAFVGGVVLTLAAAVYLLHSENIGLRSELAEVRAASASYKNN